jgi:hypothetical protein
VRSTEPGAGSTAVPGAVITVRTEPPGSP